MNVVAMKPPHFTIATGPPHTTDIRAGFYVDGHQLERFGLNCPQQAIERSEYLAKLYRRKVYVWLRAFNYEPLRLCSRGEPS